MIAGPNFGCTSNQSGLSNTTSSTARMSYTRRLPRGTMSSSSGVGRGSQASSAAAAGRVGPRARREVRQVAADVVEDRFVVFGEVVDHPAGQRDAGPAEVLLRNLFARRLFHDRRTRGEDRALAAHDGEVAHRRNQGAVPGRRTEQARPRSEPCRSTAPARADRWGCGRNALRWAGNRHPREASPAGPCRATPARRAGSAWRCRRGRCCPRGS